jgi:superkiller protein 3
VSVPLKQLWSFSALPILIVLAVLVGVGTYLQVVAVRIQGQPLVIDVEADRVVEVEYLEAGIERLQEDELPDFGSFSGPAAEALEALQTGKLEQGVTSLQDLMDKEPGQSQDPRLRLALARGLMDLGRLEEALDVLESEEEAGGYEATFRFNRGLIHQRQDRTAQAEADYREALKLRPTYYEAAFNLGSLYLSRDENGEAISALVTGSRTLYNLAIAYTRVGMYSNAEQAYIESINLVPQNLKARINLAQVYREYLDRPLEAEKVYNEVLKLDNRYAPAYYGLGLLRLKEGERSQALSLLEKSIAYDPTHDKSRKQLAVLLFEEGDLRRARSQLNWMIENSSDLPGAYFYLGRIEYSERNLEKAAESYRNAFEQSGGTHLESLNNLGITLKELGQSSRAEETFRKALEIQPDYANAFYNLGLLYLEEESYSEAQAVFEAAVASDPEFEEAWYNLGIVYGTRGSAYQAIEAYESALRLQPAMTKARLNLAVQYRKTDQIEKAVEQYKLLLSINPSYASAWYNLALAQKELGRIEEAATSYRRAIELEPQETKYYQNLAILYAASDRIENAVGALSEGLEIEPDNETLRYLLALQLRKLGRPARAVEEFMMVTVLSPGYLKAWLALGDLHSDLDNSGAAAEAFETALAIDGEDPYTRYALGKEYYRLKRYTEAATEYERSLEELRDNAWIWYHLGKALQALGRPEESEQAYNQTLSLDPAMGRLVFQRLEDVEDSIQLLKGMIEEESSNTSLRLQLAQQYLRAGQQEEALQELKEAKEREPGNAAVWLSLGELYLEVDDYRQAEVTLAEAWRLFPDLGGVALAYGKALVAAEKQEDAMVPLRFAATTLEDPLAAWKELGELHYELKQYDQAVEAFARARALDPEDGRNLVDLGKAYYRGKDYEKALEIFLQAKLLLPEYSWAGIWLGRAYARLEDYATAEKVYRRVVESDPGFIQGYISLGDIYTRQDRNEEAILYYQKALEIDPLHDSTRRKLDRLDSIPGP